MTTHRRNEQGQDIATEDETETTLGMEIINGATYHFHGNDYRATLEEDSSDTMACFQRLPVNQVDDEPSMFLDRRDGAISSDIGLFLGEYNELELVEAGDRHDFNDAPETAYLAYTTNQGWEVVCSICDGETESHRDSVTDYAARHTYAAYGRR